MSHFAKIMNKMATRDGHLYEPNRGSVQNGLPSKATVEPKTNVSSNAPGVFDVIVLGAGYAGLTSARDLTVAGLKVLLLEARDRIGGRTFTAEVDGHLFEMGGTWVHWNQPHVYREMSRYGRTKLVSSVDPNAETDHFTLSIDGKIRKISYEEGLLMANKAFIEFCDVDGTEGRTILPFPHDPHANAEIRKWEQLSAADRINQIREKLSDTEIATLQSYLAVLSGNDMEHTGFFDIFRWWALCGYSVDGLSELTETYKLAKGQSDLARCFFDEALQTGNLSYAFDTSIGSVHDQSGRVIVRSLDGLVWTAKKLICTIPLNTLLNVSFDPQLPAIKSEAARIGHIGHGAKVHFVTKGPVLRSWSAAAWPVHRVTSARGDALTPAGDSALVLFGRNRQSPSIEEDIKDFIADAEKLDDLDIKQAVWHNWPADPLSKGTWCMFPPDFSFRYLDALRERHGNFLFASGDWALGWRGFIDGAIEEGTRAAKTVSDELHGRPTPIMPDKE